MCLAGQVPAASATAAEAMAMVQAGLGWLATADVASLPTAEHADCLRGLERAESKVTAARSRVLDAFNAQCGYEDDGCGSARTWLKWQCPGDRRRGRSCAGLDAPPGRPPGGR
jgi:hypothetical protein